MKESKDHLRLNALKAAAYDTLVQIETLQGRLRELQGLIAEETRRLHPPGDAEEEAEACPPSPRS